jgi:hypothetical protein
MMIEVFRTTDLVQLSYLLARLESEGLEPFVADRFMAAAEGGISAFPRRVLVRADFVDAARAIVAEVQAMDLKTPSRAQDE